MVDSFNQIFDDAAACAAAAISNSMCYPSPANLKLTIEVLVRGLGSSSPAAVAGAAAALVKLCNKSASDNSRLIVNAGALPLLVAALQKEATARAAAKLLSCISDVRGIGHILGSTEGMLPALTEALEFEGAAGEAAYSLGNTLNVCGPHAAAQLGQTQGVIARLVRMLAQPPSAGGAATVLEVHAH